MTLSNAQRQRRYIKRLKADAAKAKVTEKPRARIRELEAANEALGRRVKVLLRWHETEMRKLRDRQNMPHATFRAVIKCLHPDQRRGMTSKQIDEACGLFTQWKKSQDR